ncbi:MAG: hypothetical protein LBD82_08315, partial [Deltaproteobacteria bacterium]|nr:hypothetical protein [Deltaproteobacteria bacterium]
RLRGGGRETLPQFEAIYRESDAQDKRALEMRLFRLLHGVNPSQLPFLLGATNEYNESRYPYALIRLENARRLFWESKTQDQARENLAYLRDGSQLLDQSLFSVWNQPDWTTLKKVRVHNKALVLVLPLSGQYGNLSEKIVQGTEAALSGLRRHGRAMRLFVIDSDEPGWTEKLKALPPEARLVGGPLRREDYLALRSLGILEERLYFAFLPQLDEADEGVTAWRFFPSRQDQTRVMLDFASGLGLTDYAVFAPDAGEYSRQMFDLFYSLAAEKELKVARAGYYPSAQYQLWVKSVSDFLGITQDTPDNFPLDFQAMFLPDNWSNSFNMISHVFYCIENNILFMGTNLWEHGLTAQDHLPLRNFRLAVFPGGWNPQNPAISAGNLRSVSALRRTTADFWLSLGHDFALMAAALKLPEQPDPEEVNAALASLPDLPWSGAPTQWDDHGLARQELFVLAPAENGFTSVNLERIKARLNQTQSSAIVHRERSRPGRRLNAEPVEPD